MSSTDGDRHGSHRNFEGEIVAAEEAAAFRFKERMSVEAGVLLDARQVLSVSKLATM